MEPPCDSHKEQFKSGLFAVKVGPEGRQIPAATVLFMLYFNYLISGLK